MQDFLALQPWFNRKFPIQSPVKGIHTAILKITTSQLNLHPDKRTGEMLLLKQ